MEDVPTYNIQSERQQTERFRAFLKPVLTPKWFKYFFNQTTLCRRHVTNREEMKRDDTIQRRVQMTTFFAMLLGEELLLSESFSPLLVG
jgi:hypothetical protein